MTINWKEGRTPISELTLDNFTEFAETYAQYTYLLCYKATLKDKEAEALSVSALSRVISRESAKTGSSAVYPEEGIKNAVKPLLTKQQISNLDNESIKPAMIPDQELCAEIAKKAAEKAAVEMPRYARVFTGTTGALTIVGIVAIIILAVALVWVNPFSCSSGAASAAEDMGQISAISRPDPELLIDIAFESHRGKANAGVEPIIATLEGPDTTRVSEVAGYNAAGEEISVWQCGVNRYCFIAESDGIYRLVARSDSGELAAYRSVSRIKGADAESPPEQSYIVLTHNEQARLTLDSSAVITAKPEKGELVATVGGYDYIAGEGADGIGLCSVSYSLADGSEYTIPILVTNSLPYVESSSLAGSCRNTPTKRGYFAGRIMASDADGDTVRYTLGAQVGCSVMIAPNGGYLLLVDEDYRGENASFSFTVSDGILTSETYTVNISLVNNLLWQYEYSFDFVCYGGENGYYELALPMTDADGDPLEWTLTSENTNGFTAANNSEIAINDAGIIRYCIDPARNTDFVDTLYFTCSDGWRSSDTITVSCNNRANQPPASSGNNVVTISTTDYSKVCELGIVDDCPFDQCVITAIDTVYGGTVPTQDGWQELQFTFLPDGTTDYCYAYVTVTDTVTGLSAVVVFEILRV